MENSKTSQTLSIIRLVEMNEYEKNAALVHLLVEAPEIFNAAVERNPIPSLANEEQVKSEARLLLDEWKRHFAIMGSAPDLWQTLVAQRRKIDAIKEYRNQTGVGLKSAKDFIEAMWGFIPEREPEVGELPRLGRLTEG